MRVGLRALTPGKKRWYQLGEALAGWIGLNLLFTNVLLRWILDAPTWLLAVSCVACLVAALFIEVFEVRRVSAPSAT